MANVLTARVKVAQHLFTTGVQILEDLLALLGRDGGGAKTDIDHSINELLELDSHESLLAPLLCAWTHPDESLVPKTRQRGQTLWRAKS